MPPTAIRSARLPGLDRSRSPVPAEHLRGRRRRHRHELAVGEDRAAGAALRAVRAGRPSARRAGSCCPTATSREPRPIAHAAGLHLGDLRGGCRRAAGSRAATTPSPPPCAAKIGDVLAVQADAVDPDQVVGDRPRPVGELQLLEVAAGGSSVPSARCSSSRWSRSSSAANAVTSGGGDVGDPASASRQGGVVRLLDVAHDAAVEGGDAGVASRARCPGWSSPRRRGTSPRRSARAPARGWASCRSPASAR